MSRAPTLFIPHGGGPCFFMDWTMGPSDTWDRMGNWLKGLGGSLGFRPSALLIVSAHWEEAEFTVTSGANPPLIYDYFGFPEHTYRLTYPAPGLPVLADEVRRLLTAAGIANRADPVRGFDHGVFIPFKLIYPDADIPIAQLSLKSGLDPAAHLAAGRALEALRDQGVLIVGSGMSFHNMADFMRGLPPVAAEDFDQWLTQAATDPDPAARDAALSRWAMVPSGRRAHPREEHLIPLLIAAGAAGSDRGERIFSDVVMSARVSAYEFGGA